MKKEPDKFNPYASPAPQPKSEPHSEKELREPTIESNQPANWTAVCIFNGCGVFITGLFFVNTPNNTNSDGSIFKMVGASMLFISLGVLVAGPLLVQWLRKDDK